MHFVRPLDKSQLSSKKHWFLVGWLGGGLGFNGPFRRCFRLYRAVSQTRRKKREKIDERKNAKQPPPAPTASAIGPCPIIIQSRWTSRHWNFTQRLRTTQSPPQKNIESRSINIPPICVTSDKLTHWEVNGYTFRVSHPVHFYFLHLWRIRKGTDFLQEKNVVSKDSMLVVLGSIHEVTKFIPFNYMYMAKNHVYHSL